MKLKLTSRAVRCMAAAGLALGMASAHAAMGYTISQDQEHGVTAGMTAAQVRSLIGSPITSEQYGNQSGPTWSYNVAGATAASSGTHLVFDVDFGADGTVTSAGERLKTDSAED